MTSCGSTGQLVCEETARCDPPAEVCNGRDDDCDGTCDQGAGCRVGIHRAFLTGRGHLYTKSSPAPEGFEIGIENEFYLQIEATAGENLRELTRCRQTADGRMYLSTSASCGTAGTPAERLGFIAPTPQCGSTPLFHLRLAANNNHVYTASAAARDRLVDDFGYEVRSSPGHVWLEP